MFRLRHAFALSLLLSSAAAFGAGLEVRFYPGKKLYAYELEARRGLSSALLQNAAIVNTTAAAVTLEKIEIEILRSIEPADAIQTHRLNAADLDKAAARGAALEAQGMLAVLAFHFRPDLLLKDAKLAPSRELPAGGALLIGQKPFVFAGKPTALRLHVFGRNAAGGEVEGSGEIPIDVDGSKVEYSFPLAGRWVVAVGATFHGGHRWAVPEEFAIDIARFGDGGKSFRGDGTQRGEYLAYGQEIRAAAAGTVVAAVSTIPESDSDFRRQGEAIEAYQQRVLENQAKLLEAGIEKAAGNYLVIDHGNGEFSFYAHLKTGSLKVEKGTKVERGQPIAQLGTSGNSTEPHLHFQVMAGADPFCSTGIPIRFQGIEIPWADSPRNLQSGDVVVAN